MRICSGIFEGISGDISEETARQIQKKTLRDCFQLPLMKFAWDSWRSPMKNFQKKAEIKEKWMKF